MAGATLTATAGGYVRTADTTISNKVITGDVTFVGSNLTLRNVRVTGQAIFRGDNLVIEDSEFGSVALSGTATARLTRVDIFGKSGQDGLQITADTGPVTGIVVKDSWIHNPVVTSTMSYEGIQVRGVDGLTVDNTFIDLGAYKSQISAAIGLENANGGSKNVTVQNSRLTGGEFVLVSQGSNLRVLDSVLVPAHTTYVKAGCTAISAFTGNTTTSGVALVYSGGVIN